MTKVELVEYVANLIAIHAHFEDGGMQAGFVRDELAIMYEELEGKLKDEARQREQLRTGRAQDRAPIDGDQPSGGGPDGRDGFNETGGGKDAPRKGLLGSKR